MRFVVARRIGRMGGLGNEMIPWAKGWIASQVLGAKLVGPSWGINKFKYYRNFGTSRLDFLLEDLLTHLPHFDFTEADYRATGEVEFGRAILKWATEKGLLTKRSFIVTVNGMWGGYPSILHGRSFLYSTMLRSKDALRNTHQVMSALDPNKLFVAVHFRAGKDLRPLPPGDEARGKFVIKVPVDWYHNVCEHLQAAFPDRIEFRIFTDRGGEEFDNLVNRFNPGQKQQPGLTELSDLILLTQSDLRVCSISSYSLLASFISEGPYAWYEPQLVKRDGSFSIWGNEEQQSAPGGLTYESARFAEQLPVAPDLGEFLRGFPVAPGGEIPDGLLQQLYRRLERKNRNLDLLQYGCVPEWILPR